MRIKPLHPNFRLPELGTELAGAFDIFMPEAGVLLPESNSVVVDLGFAAAVPAGYAALLLPRSGKGFKFGLDLNNTVGVIDEDYRGEWKAALRLKANNHAPLRWEAHERLLQFLLVPVLRPTFDVVDSLDATVRGSGGMGSTG